MGSCEDDPRHVQPLAALLSDPQNATMDNGRRHVLVAGLKTKTRAREITEKPVDLHNITATKSDNDSDATIRPNFLDQSFERPVETTRHIPDDKANGQVKL